MHLWNDCLQTKKKKKFVENIVMVNNKKKMIQKQSFADALQNRCPENFCKFTGKRL